MTHRRFAPTIAMSVTVLVAFIILIGLGSWQLSRLVEKQALIALYESNISSAPIDWHEFQANIQQDNLEPSEFQLVRLVGRFLHDKELYRTGRSRAGEPGLHVMTPFQLQDGSHIMINRGWLKAEFRDQSLRIEGLFPDQVTVEGLFRIARPVTGIRAWVLPENDPIKNTWYTLDLPMMIDHLGLQDTASGYYVMDGREGAPLPYGHQWQLNIRNSHLEYAITWYLLGLALLGMYVAFGMTRARELNKGA